MHNQPIRQLRISSLHYLPGDSEVPHIRLTGPWLEELGFTVGCWVEIFSCRGVLAIRLLEDQTSNP